MRIDEFRRVLERSFEPLVHGSATVDAARSATHRGFIAAHMGSGIAALGMVPLALVMQGAAAPFSVTALAILGLESLVALYVSRSGRLETGFLLSALVLTSLVAWVAAFTGGLSSFAIVWFAIAPIEAALSNSRKVIAKSALVGGAGLLAVALLTLGGSLPPPVTFVGGPALMNAAAGLVTLVYASMIAIRVETQHRDAETRANSGEGRYRLLADTMTDLVTCHGADGDVTFASPATARVLGVKPYELLADGLFRRVHIADRPAFLTALSEAIHRGMSAVEFRVRRGDDIQENWLWVEMLLRRTEDAALTGGVVVAVTRDIEHRKLQEDELLKARQDAEAASFAKTRFLANVSHELRTPLNAIIGFSDILGQEIFGKFEYERHHEYARLIKESGEHLLQVVNDILDMSKIEAGNFDVVPEPFDLRAVIDRCGQLMAHQAFQAGVNLRMQVEDNLPELNADRRACRQILLNLLSNAIKFSNSGGEVVYGAQREGRRMALFVRDCGIGISAEDLPRLGNPFVQAESGYDRKHEGTGLGLSVVKGLAALHGGSMSIESELGKGTTVTVYLPITGDREPTPFPKRAARDTDAAAPGRTAKRA
ncbi:sensor histidine kinase [Chthonobacter albigriseus]|uniref:sensor histidine kinase n=1 Tax=Chthonobacter albigriseus TaxID=1683161 RepID=UPI0015EF656B|nr:PAS domain-containing sensor histidine kinase [Chthonobacter albigriseus]